MTEVTDAPDNNPDRTSLHINELQQKRLEDYQRQVLRDPDARVASLNALNGQLMRIAHRLVSATEEAFSKMVAPSEELSMILPAVAACGQLSRQIYRLAELDRRLQGSPVSGEKNQR